MSTHDLRARILKNLGMDAATMDPAAFDIPQDLEGVFEEQEDPA